MLNEMATGIAHEINQPLTSISMYAQTAIRLLHSGSPDLERLEDALNKMSAQAQRAGSVIERMQSMVRHRDSHRENISCNTLVKGILNLAEVEAKMRNIDIDFQVVSQEYFVFCDPVQIQQVALNLLRNGMQAMESINCENGNLIMMKIEEEKSSIKFSVIDRGAGITPKIEKILFEPFSSSKKNSLGVGLSLCQSIISSHGGQMGYTNNINGGANFYYTLPKIDKDS
jgi:two-component system sensor kinase FixL